MAVIKVLGRNRPQTKQGHQNYLKHATKRVRLTIPWLDESLINDQLVLDLNPHGNNDHTLENPIQSHIPKNSKCLTCRGTRLSCGKSSCPVNARYYSLIRNAKGHQNKTIIGDSPPSLFVGRMGYPSISIGPMVPPIRGDTAKLASPESWYGTKSIYDIIDFRSVLVRGKTRIHVKQANSQNQSGKKGRIAEGIQNLALSKTAITTEMNLKKPPKHHLTLQDNIQPVGPTAPMEDFQLGQIKVNQNLWKAAQDTDLLSKSAILSLYQKGVPITTIQQALSAGCFGLKNNRKFVPTRWGITAVDSQISINTITQLKSFPLINDFEVYESNYMGNRFIVILLPTAWRYELVEAFFPGSAWNMLSRSVALCSDYEYHNGRTKYAKIGGCYYAARLATSDHLLNRQRQAGVLVLREAYPQYILPIGVWLVRECVRHAFDNPGIHFATLQDVLSHLQSRFIVPLNTWNRGSQLLHDAHHQSTLTEFWNDKYDF